jgi:hypothetical protein
MKRLPHKVTALKADPKMQAEAHTWYCHRSGSNKLDIGAGGANGYVCLTFGPDTSNISTRLKAFLDLLKTNEAELLRLAYNVVANNPAKAKKFNLPPPDTE